MFKAFEFCLPTNSTKVPAGPKFLALVMVASAVVVSSTSAFAQPHKRTHYRSSNSMNVIRGRSNGSPRGSRAQVSAYPKNPDGAADRSKHWIKVKNRKHKAFDRVPGSASIPRRLGRFPRRIPQKPALF